MKQKVIFECELDIFFDKEKELYTDLIKIIQRILEAQVDTNVSIETIEDKV